jgi:predicted nucleic acid-binding protein
MIAVDSSSLLEFFAGGRGADVDAVRQALLRREAVLPPVVITEVLSNPGANADLKTLLSGLDVLPVRHGYWERAGELRGALLRAGRKAKLPDCLVAQSCIDHDVPLVTRDDDFRHFPKFGLKLVK